MGRRKHIPDEYMPCRDYGHLWLPYDAVIERKPRRIRRILLCGKCKTRRTQTLDAKYDIVGNSYTYPKGYVLDGRLDSSDRAAIRQRNTASMFYVHEGD